MLNRKELIRLRSEAHDAEQALRRIGETNIANRTPGELVTIELYYTKQKIKVEQAVQAYQNALAEFAAQELADEQKEQAEADERFVVAFNNLKGSVAPDAFEDQMNERAASEGWKPDDDYVEEWEQQERKVLHGVEARQPVPGETKRRVMTEAEKQARILEEFGPEPVNHKSHITTEEREAQQAKEDKEWAERRKDVLKALEDQYGEIVNAEDVLALEDKNGNDGAAVRDTYEHTINTDPKSADY